MKTIFYFPILLLFILCNNCVYARQLGDTLHKVPDTLHKTSIDSTVTPSVDSFAAKKDSLKTSFHPVVKAYKSVMDSLFFANKFINVKTPPVLLIAEKRETGGKEFVFYSLCIVVLILGLFKTLYRGYFNNLFRVFFNTSIRQTQLTDQLLQAKLPSFILNIFFSISAGFYIWVLFKNYHPPRLINSQLLLPFCILGVSGIYFVKFIALKFMGWMGEMQQAANNYIFVIFLVNKIAGIILVPFIILLAFAMPLWLNYLTTFSLLLVAMFFLSRYVKTYSLLEYKFPLNPLHFVIYIISVEIVPLFLIYKMIVDYVI